MENYNFIMIMKCEIESSNGIMYLKGIDGDKQLEIADYIELHESSIFLDEIGEINQSVQIKILRVLQERAFERVGGQETINVDVRIIAATNRNLEDEVKKGTFREDLYYRLNVIHIHVPALRERKDDIPLLISKFLEEFSAENGKTIKGISPQAKSAIYNYNWPGNIRELRNCIESAVVLCGSDEIQLEDLPPAVSKAGTEKAIIVPANLTLDEAEKIIILQTLAANKNNSSKTGRSRAEIPRCRADGEPDPAKRAEPPVQCFPRFSFHRPAHTPPRASQRLWRNARRRRGCGPDSPDLFRECLFCFSS